MALAYAESLVGLAYPSARYVEQLYPHDTPADARRLAASQSSCALTAMAVLRAVGAHALGLDGPYVRHIGRVVAIVKGIGIRDGAWVDAVRWSELLGLPALGDIVLLGRQGGGRAWGRGPYADTEHVVTVLRYDPGTGCVTSCDGGQPGIAERTRRVVDVAGELWLGALGAQLETDGRPSRGRRVDGWVDLDRLDLG